jgi:hypothetical protein
MHAIPLHTIARGLLNADADPWRADSMRGSFRELDVTPTNSIHHSRDLE